MSVVVGVRIDWTFVCGWMGFRKYLYLLLERICDTSVAGDWMDRRAERRKGGLDICHLLFDRKWELLGFTGCE